MHFPLLEYFDPHVRSQKPTICYDPCDLLSCVGEMLTGHVAKSNETCGFPPFSKFPANLLGQTQFGCFIWFWLEYHQKWNGIYAELSSNTCLRIQNPYSVLKNTDFSKKGLVLYGKWFIKYADLQ